ncbi:MAG TPA: hypothetical protein VFO19_01980 [Vicinamibacterales bacterium]|nr:hypothetical protein [Vicinamibacterales bacterium]
MDRLDDSRHGDAGRAGVGAYQRTLPAMLALLNVTRGAIDNAGRLRRGSG